MKITIKFLAVAMVAVMLCLALASCGGPNADPDKALEALQENGVSWAAKDENIAPGLMRLAGIEGVECVVSGSGKINDEYAHITIIYFEKAENAKEEWEDVQQFSDDEKNDETADSEWVFKRSGKMIYYGTRNAVEAAK